MAAGPAVSAEPSLTVQLARVLSSGLQFTKQLSGGFLHPPGNTSASVAEISNALGIIHFNR